MNNKKTFISFLLSITFFMIIIINEQSTLSSVYNQLISFISYSFPALFISISIGTLLIKNNISYYLSKIIPNYAIRLMILSFLLGFPNNILLLKKDYQDQIIDETELSYLISFTTVPSLFYVSSILKNWLWIFLFYLINIITSLFFIKKIKAEDNVKYNSFSLKNYISNDIPNVFTQLLSICSIVLFFSIFISLINNTNSIFNVLLIGLIEFTSGINLLKLLSTSPIKKGILALIILCFNSLSISIQLSYFLNNIKVNYKYYLLSRFLILITGISILTFCIYTCN